MSSSAQFSSGLNNWADSDKPLRLDFVNDNRILDENAMWKAAYDATGAVAAAGGIEAYALAKGAYDETGTVAGAGGIVPFVNQSAHGFTRNYGRANAVINADSGALEITSLAAHNEPFYEVQFIAPGPYDADRPITIDGEVMVEVLGMDGEDIQSNAWDTGVPVSLIKRGTSAFFKQGGGAGANYDVVSGTTLPDGKENRFWVKTSVGIPHYGIIDGPPTEETECPWGEKWVGDVFIVGGGKTKPIITSKGKKGTVTTPQYVCQWDGERWGFCQAQKYSDGEWKAFDRMLFDSGTENVPFTASVCTREEKHEYSH